MPLKEPNLIGNILGTVGSSAKGRSGAIWHDCPWEEIAVGNVAGTAWYFDFASMPKTPPTTEGNFGEFAAFSDTGGTIDADTGQGGGWVLGSDGDNEGASIRTRNTPFKLIRNGYSNKLWFEARVKSSTITDTKHNILFGLSEDTAFSATVPITAAGAIADKNLFGFRRTEAASGGALIDWVYKADGVTAVTIASAIATLVADTYVKLGFKFEPRADVIAGTTYLLTAYVNGVRVSTTKQLPSAAGTDFPNDIGLGFFFAVLNATASTPGTSTIDEVRIAQAFEPVR